ncbi:MAG: hypothetical protein J5601_01695 [Elusimicrobiaceae bacterium]|nr:hypothetical protein [Elusimicrobiaceae bacterium]
MKKAALLCMCIGLALPMFAQERPQEMEHVKTMELPSLMPHVYGDYYKTIPENYRAKPSPELASTRRFRSFVTFNEEGKEVIVENPATLEKLIREGGDIYIKKIDLDGNVTYIKWSDAVTDIEAAIARSAMIKDFHPKKEKSFVSDVSVLLVEARIEDENLFELTMKAGGKDLSGRWSPAQSAALYAVVEAVLTVRNVDAQDDLLAYMEEKLGNYSNLDPADKEEFLNALKVCQDITRERIQEKEVEYEEFERESLLADIETLKKVLEYLESVEEIFQ